MTPGFREAVRPHLLPEPPPLAGGRPAAVLVPVLETPEPALVLTRRTDSLRHHRGEVSFPGGRPHPGDRDLLATALRETHEELGLPAEAVEVLGMLDPVPTRSSGFVVLPYVGVVAERPEFVPSPEEIAEVIEAPIAELLRIEEEMEWEEAGTIYQTYVYGRGGSTIWGATARMVKQLLDLLRKEGWG